MLKKHRKDYGGSLRNTRKGRAGARPLSTRHTMHLILKSSKANGEMNFLRPIHNGNIRRLLAKFASRYGVKLISIATASNHLHLQIKLSNRFTYDAFIRAITGAIAMSVTGRSRWKKSDAGMMAMKAAANDKTTETAKTADVTKTTGTFWDHRPFTRIAESYKAYLNLKDYIRMNEIEAAGWRRKDARSMVQVEKQLQGSG